MKSFGNTFVRGPSPSYSDEAISENALSVTLPISAAGELCRIDSEADNIDYFAKRPNSACKKLSRKQPTMIRRQGRNTFAFWAIIIILLLLTIGNLILTLTIIGVLRLGKGIHGMELIPEMDVIKFYGTTDLDRVYTKNVGQIEGFTDVPVSITGETDNGVHIRVYKNGVLNDRLVMGKEGTVVCATNSFEVKDSIDKRPIFTTHHPQYNIPAGVDALYAKTVSTSRITSEIDEPLSITSTARIALKGSEGISIDGGAALLQAGQHIIINSTQGATILEAGSGIYLDMSRIPILNSEFGIRTGSVQYKICVCMPQGILFRIAVPRTHNAPRITCAHFNPKVDPCVLN